MTRPVCSTCGHQLTECEDVSGYYCEMCVYGRIRSCKEHAAVILDKPDEECWRCLRRERDELKMRIERARWRLHPLVEPGGIAARTMTIEWDIADAYAALLGNPDGWRDETL